MSEQQAQPARTADALPEAVRSAVRSARSRKAFDVVVLFLGGSQAFTDYFVVCSARSARQVRAIADEIRLQLRAMQEAPSHVEGYDHGEWVLMDCFDFVVHVFTPDTRRFYDLERLWGSAVRIPVPERPDSSPQPAARGETPRRTETGVTAE